jgi:hypothetical protein
MTGSGFFSSAAVPLLQKTAFVWFDKSSLWGELKQKWDLCVKEIFLTISRVWVGVFSAGSGGIFG